MRPAPRLAGVFIARRGRRPDAPPALGGLEFSLLLLWRALATRALAGSLSVASRVMPHIVEMSNGLRGTLKSNLPHTPESTL